jgi:hypothetical protein
VSGQLHLPPGWRLLHASGVDEVADTWLQRWTLLDIFLVLVIAVAIGRLYRLGLGDAGGGDAGAGVPGVDGAAQRVAVRAGRRGAAAGAAGGPRCAAWSRSIAPAR